MSRRDRIRRRVHNPRIPGLARTATIFRVSRPQVPQKVVSTKVVSLFDEAGRWIGSVDPLTGRVFNRTGNPVSLNRGRHKNHLYAALRAAADRSGVRMSASVQERAENQEQERATLAGEES